MHLYEKNGKKWKKHKHVDGIDIDVYVLRVCVTCVMMYFPTIIILNTLKHAYKSK